MWTDIKKTLSIQLLFLIIGLALVLFSNGGQFFEIEWQPLLEGLGFLLISISLVSFIYRIIIRNDEIESRQELTNKIVTEVKKRLLFNSKILDSGVLRVEEDFQEQKNTRNSEGEYLVLNTYMPNYFDKQTVIRERIADGKLQKVNFHLLDAGKEKMGLEFLKLRSETLDGHTKFTITEAINNFKQILRIGEDLNNGTLKSQDLREFNLYLYNIAPTIFAMQFSRNEVYLSFFYFKIKANNCPQFVIDITSSDSIIAKCFLRHVRELREHKDTTKYDLLNEKGLNELKKYIEMTEANN